MTLPVVLLSIGWGCAAGAPLVLWGSRADARGRVGDLRAGVAPCAGGSGRREAEGGSPNVGVWILRRFGAMPGVAHVARVLRAALLARRHRREAAALGAELPVAIDLLGVAVGAGCAPYLALEIATKWAPPLVAERLGAVTRSCRLGVSLAEALDVAGRTSSPLRPVTDALCATVRRGAPVGPLLARLGEEARAEVRRAAEAHARTVPVRMLFPLVLCVLPAFGLLTVVPAVIAGLRPG